MSEEISDVCDRLSRLSKDLTKVAKVLGNQKAPVVNVPAAEAPNVTVQPPVVHVAAPSVKVEKQPAVAWNFRVTKRDKYGYIETFTATPKSE